MDGNRVLALVVGALALGWVLAPGPARSEPELPTATTRTVEYTAQCFVDTVTERRWCERKSDVARLIDCTTAETILTCRMEYMQLMGRSGWTLLRVAGGTTGEWYDSPLFFYERVTLRTGPSAE